MRRSATQAHRHPAHKRMPIHKGAASSIAISLAARERAGRCAHKLAARKLAAMARSSHPEPREPGRCNYISSQTL